MYFIQHCFICSPSDSIMSADAGIEPRKVATSEMAVRRSNQSARSRSSDGWANKKIGTATKRSITQRLRQKT